MSPLDAFHLLTSQIVLQDIRVITVPSNVIILITENIAMDSASVKRSLVISPVGVFHQTKNVLMDTLAKDAKKTANIHHMEKIVNNYVNVSNLFAILPPDVTLSIIMT